MTLKLAQQLMGAPRHLGQHPGGFVLTHDRLDDLVPIEPAAMVDRQVIEWDKDDVEALKFMKVDVLALGMLTCMAKAFVLIREHKDEDLDLAKIPQEDPTTYAMIRKADTLGTFQIESRAQMAMLPRLKPRTFYDCDRATWSDPGRYGASLSPSPGGQGASRLPDAGTGGRSRQDPRCSALPGVCDEGRDGLRQLHRRRGRSASQEHGHL
ncbi:hypothetical protein ACVJBD_002215 [Rhizobium mongolense]